MSDTGELILDGVKLTIIIAATIFTIVGNGLVMFAYAINPRFRSPQNLYICSLAFVDFLMGVFILPADIAIQIKAPWVGTNFICKFRFTFAIILCNLSVFNLTAISVDRYRVISEGVHYIQNRTYRNVLETVVYMWLIAVWVSANPIINWTDDTKWKNLNAGVCSYKATKGWIFQHDFGLFFLPTTLIFAMYYKIYIGLKKRIRAKSRSPYPTSSPEPSKTSDIFSDLSSVEVGVQNSKSSKTFFNCSGLISRCCRIGSTGTNIPSIVIENSEKSDVDEKNEHRLSEIGIPTPKTAKKNLFSIEKEKKAARTLGLIIGGYLICWIPYILAHTSAFFVHIEALHTPKVYAFLIFMGHANSGVNPVIYSVCNEDFRNSFRNVRPLVNAVILRARNFLRI